MDTTATRARRIWDLPLLLQVPKLKTTQRGHAAFWELPLLLQVPKLKTTPILYSTNHQQHLSGHIFLLSFPNRGVHLIVLQAALFTVSARRG